MVRLANSGFTRTLFLNTFNITLIPFLYFRSGFKTAGQNGASKKRLDPTATPTVPTAPRRAWAWGPAAQWGPCPPHQGAPSPPSGSWVPENPLTVQAVPWSPLKCRDPSWASTSPIPSCPPSPSITGTGSPSILSSPPCGRPSSTQASTPPWPRLAAGPGATPLPWRPSTRCWPACPPTGQGLRPRCRTMPRCCARPPADRRPLRPPPKRRGRGKTPPMTSGSKPESSSSSSSRIYNPRKTKSHRCG